MICSETIAGLSTILRLPAPNSCTFPRSLLCHAQTSNRGSGARTCPSHRKTCQILLRTCDFAIEEHLLAHPFLNFEGAIVSPFGAPTVHGSKVLHPILSAPGADRHSMRASIPFACRFVNARFVCEEIRIDCVNHCYRTLCHYLCFGSGRRKAEDLITRPKEQIVVHAPPIAGRARGWAGRSRTLGGEVLQRALGSEIFRATDT